MEHWYLSHRSPDLLRFSGFNPDAEMPPEHLGVRCNVVKSIRIAPRISEETSDAVRIRLIQRCAHADDPISMRISLRDLGNYGLLILMIVMTLALAAPLIFKSAAPGTVFFR
jgi:hypothetical protein